MSDLFDAEVCCDCGGLGVDSGEGCTRCGSARHGQLILELSLLVHRLRKHVSGPAPGGPPDPFNDAISALILEAAESEAMPPPPRSEAARRSAARRLVEAAHLIIAHGGDVGDAVAKVIERLSSRLDDIEAGTIREQRLSRILSEIGEMDPQGKEIHRVLRALGLDEHGGTT